MPNTEKFSNHQAVKISEHKTPKRPNAMFFWPSCPPSSSTSRAEIYKPSIYG